MVTDGESLDTGTDGGDDPGALVPAEHGEPRRRNAAGHQVVIGVAQAGGLELHRDLTAPRLADLDVLDRPWLVDAPQQRGPGPHDFVRRRLRRRKAAN